MYIHMYVVCMLHIYLIMRREMEKCVVPHANFLLLLRSDCRNQGKNKFTRVDFPTPPVGRAG